MKEKQPTNGEKEETIQADWRLEYPRKTLAGEQYLKQLSDLWEGWDACIRQRFSPTLTDPFLLADLIDTRGAPAMRRPLIPKRGRQGLGLPCQMDQSDRKRPLPKKNCFEYLYMVESIKRCASHIASIDDDACNDDCVVAFAVTNHMQLACAYRHLLQSYLEVAWNTDEGFCQVFNSEKDEWVKLSPYKTLRRVLDRCDTRFKQIVCSVVLYNNREQVIDGFISQDWIDGIFQPKAVQVRVQREADGVGERLVPSKIEMAGMQARGYGIPKLLQCKINPPTASTGNSAIIMTPEPHREPVSTPKKPDDPISPTDMLNIRDAAAFCSCTKKTICNRLKKKNSDGSPMIHGVIGKGRLTRIPRASLEPFRKRQ